ncbi:Sphingolipid long chain base-responsive protein PIL1 [Psilocybe cubensis]|uniref:Eisosome component PIL1-domain-containing protein n=2 Tax=Psilocybe cubensis TaxID=181762 RepID=A0A8H7XLM4_PSICU|nr:Sphingolipid long chain base-responsive protein PIL1 [Psilocybe cubensis]KAH9476315.1 Sphingolipid long chain base-responsive protein PIL1 [Psilocybe cubensis]
MFRTAATKIAHNSTIPALGGNQDLRPLQDLITAEKAVLISLQKLSVDYSKASEALRTWGLNEGDDLGDILSASTTILNHFSAALSQYATHGHSMRDQLKAIRTREESLADLKQRRRTVVRKAEDAEKKLSKMSPEHKNLAMQTDLLNRLRDEIRTMDSDIMTEEAALGDFKRSATRGWMGLKFGGLLECCEKGTIAAEFGKMIISEISEEITQPGLPRSLYYGQSKTENLVAEAGRCINEVVLSTVPSVGARDRRHYEQQQQQDLPPQPSSPTAGWETKPQPLQPTTSDYLGNSQRAFGNETPASPIGVIGQSFTDQPYAPQHRQQLSGGSGFQSPPMLPEIQSEFADRPPQITDDFGMNTRTAGLMDTSNAVGGRFATFPVKTRAPGSTGGYSLQDPPRQHGQDTSFSASVAEALDGKMVPENQSSFGGRNATGQPPWSSPGAASFEFSPPPPAPSMLPPASPAASSHPPPPPPGAAPPNLTNSWREDTMQAPGHNRGFSANDDALLAYMMTPSASDDLQTEDGTTNVSTHDNNTLVAHNHEETEQQRISRHVRFGEVQDVVQEMEKKKSLEKERQAQIGVAEPEPIPIPTQQDSYTTEGNNKSDTGNGESTSPTNKPPSYRIPAPPYVSDDDEKALNAAAARDVAREMESLNSQTNLSNMNQQSETDSIVERGRSPPASQGFNEKTSIERDRSPLAPPKAPFAGRAVSPHPYAELNANAPAPTPYGGPLSAAQSYAQSYQDQGSPYGSPSLNSPAQAYAQPYQASSAYSQPTSTDNLHANSSLPPRFQALNRSSDNQVPPRFQSTPGSPGTTHQLPPRFQVGGSSQIPPAGISLPGQQQFDTVRKDPNSEATTPYRTPPEYPRALGVSTSSFTRSTSSLNAAAGAASSPSGTGPSASGPRTISAAAFKRPRNASTDTGDYVKKSLPSSPYPLRDQGERGPSLSGATAVAPPPTTGANPQPVGRTQADVEDDYDYISAYVNSSNPSSPIRGDFPSNAPGQGTSLPAGLGGKAGGYGDGRFTTDLEGGSSLR